MRKCLEVHLCLTFTFLRFTHIVRHWWKVSTEEVENYKEGKDAKNKLVKYSKNHQPWVFNMESQYISEVYLGLCAQLYSLAEIQQPPPHFPPHLGLYTRGLLVSQDSRHLFVTPIISVQEIFNLENYSSRIAVMFEQCKTPLQLPRENNENATKDLPQCCTWLNSRLIGLKITARSLQLIPPNDRPFISIRLNFCGSVKRAPVGEQKTSKYFETQCKQYTHKTWHNTIPFQGPAM